MPKPGQLDLLLKRNQVVLLPERSSFVAINQVHLLPEVHMAMHVSLNL